jgi:hypothetical protein
MKKNQFTIIQWLNCLALFVILFSMTGCNLGIGSWPSKMDHQNDGVEQASLKKGYRAFQLKDFQKAEKIFAALQNIENKEISKKAQYALACTKWVAADTPEAAREAFGRWKKVRTGDPQMATEDSFRMLEVFIETMFLPPHCQGPADMAGEHQCQQLVNERDIQIDQLRLKIKQTKGEVRLLKKKIKSIEEIDQKIQEKKKNVPLQRKPL